MNTPAPIIISPATIKALENIKHFPNSPRLIAAAKEMLFKEVINQIMDPKDQKDEQIWHGF